MFDIQTTVSLCWIICNTCLCFLWYLSLKPSVYPLRVILRFVVFNKGKCTEYLICCPSQFNGALGGIWWWSSKALFGILVYEKVSWIVPEFYWEMVMKFLFRKKKKYSLYLWIYCCREKEESRSKLYSSFLILQVTKSHLNGNIFYFFNPMLLSSLRILK